LLSVALGRLSSTALSGRSKERQQVADTTSPFGAKSPMCRRAEERTPLDDFRAKHSSKIRGGSTMVIPFSGAVSGMCDVVVSSYVVRSKPTRRRNVPLSVNLEDFYFSPEAEAAPGSVH
jgi:hypothetical protein